MADEIVDAAIDGIEFRDLSPEYFHLSPIPRDWYEDETASITELGDRGEYEDVLTRSATTCRHTPTTASSVSTP